MPVAWSQAEAHRPLSEINVTPFVDVMLVLLIIFMVTVPLLEQGISVNLPDATTTPLRLPSEPLMLFVQKDGTIFVADQQVPMEGVVEKLKAVLASRGDEAIYLKADQDAPYGTVARVLAAARRAGAVRLGIVTEPE